MRYCTVPEIFNLRKWFEKSFHHACQFHDKLYAAQRTSRLKADIELVKYMHKSIKDKTLKSKLLVYYPTIAITFIGVRVFGWMRY